MTKPIAIFILLSSATTALPLFGSRFQDAEEGSTQNLRKATPVQAAPETTWRERLTEEDLDRRELAFDEVVISVRSDRALRGALERWAKGTDDLAWTSRLVLKAVSSTDTDFPWAPFFNDDNFGGWHGFPGRFLSDNDFFPDDLLQTPPQRGWQGQKTEGQSVKVEVGPDGVRVELNELQPDGSSERLVYEAESLDELLELHPELKDRMDLVPPLSLSTPRLGRADSFRNLLQLDPRKAFTVPQARAPWDSAARRDVLGVYLAEDEKTLTIDTVVPGSYAQAMGLTPGQELLEVNGQVVSNVQDVHNAMAAYAAEKDSTLSVKVRSRAGEEKTLSLDREGPTPEGSPKTLHRVGDDLE